MVGDLAVRVIKSKGSWKGSGIGPGGEGRGGRVIGTGRIIGTGRVSGI